MSFRQNGYLTIWETRAGKGNYTEARVSSSKKRKDTGEYETDFSGWVRFIGAAHQAAQGLKERDRIKIGECEVTNSYNKEKNTTYTNYAIFTFEPVNGSSQNAQPKANDDFMNIDGDIDECLPLN